MQESISTLSHAVRLHVIAKYLGQLGLMLALLTTVPLLASLYFQEFFISWRYVTVIAAILLLAIPAARLEAPENIQSNEALAITALAFMITPLIMSYPLMGAGLDFGDALFEAVSAVTTTGLSTQETLFGKPQTLLFARAWMQWYGGLGVIVLSVALLMGHHLSIRRLMEPVVGESMITSTRSYARRMLLIYLALTAIGLVVLWLLLGDGFSALTYILSAISTGGFAIHDGSLADIDSWAARYAILFFSLCGALPLMLYYRAVHGSWSSLWHDVEVRALLAAIVLITLLLMAAFLFREGWGLQESAAHALLMAASAQTTAGFSSIDIATLEPLAKVVMIIAMAMGGCVGSTAGGIKLLRLLIMFRMFQLMVQRSALPSHAVVNARLGGKRLEEDEINRALLLILLFIVVMLLSWLPFLFYDYAAEDALFEVVSALATVGLSSGITNPDLEPLLKGVLCFDMWFGRLEIVALLIVLYPPTWIGKRTE